MEKNFSDLTLCDRSLQDFFKTIETFHGWTAPGIVLGGFMVDWATELVGPGTEADAIVETRYCLPDAVQLFTPCTIGNGWMKILDWDKFALSLYDRRSLSGYRVWFDLEKAHDFPDLYNWYMRKVAKKDLPLERLLDAILEAGRSALSSKPIEVTKFHTRLKKSLIEVCSGCGEAYPAAQGSQCTTCQGDGYYDWIGSPAPRSAVLSSVK